LAIEDQKSVITFSYW